MERERERGGGGERKNSSKFELIQTRVRKSFKEKKERVRTAGVESYTNNFDKSQNIILSLLNQH